MRHFLDQSPQTVTHPSQIVVIGDRMLTDVMLGNFMGSWTVWLTRGVIRTNDAVRFPIPDIILIQFTLLEKSLFNTQNLFRMIPRFPSSPNSKA